MKRRRNKIRRTQKSREFPWKSVAAVVEIVLLLPRGRRGRSMRWEGERRHSQCYKIALIKLWLQGRKQQQYMRAVKCCRWNQKHETRKHKRAKIILKLPKPGSVNCITVKLYRIRCTLYGYTSLSRKKTMIVINIILSFLLLHACQVLLFLSCIMANNMSFK